MNEELIAVAEFLHKQVWSSPEVVTYLTTMLVGCG
ncbi:hypothetical protein GGR21_000036 [Dysgonomonas hofstadii]|uniref:Uncharacterized protein n=1 Tax=Dysgonomonas hofstadii TaxID=637886 RepID=A0A840CG10_9BACT|nr:hypothetical protein [Dysgonomonas hofstadii]